MPEEKAPILFYISKPPKPKPFGKFLKDWFIETKDRFLFLLQPTEMVLPEPEKKLLVSTESVSPVDIKERLSYAKTLVDAAEKRLETVRTKANSLLGFVSFLSSVMSWSLVAGHERINWDSGILSYLFGFLLMVSLASFALCLLALFRSQSVSTFSTSTPDIFFDLEKGESKAPDWSNELIVLFKAWGDIHRWSDIVTDFFRAGQRFLSIALITTLLACSIAYLYPSTATKTPQHIANLNSEITVLAPTNIPESIFNWWELLGLLGIGITITAFTTAYLKQQHTQASPSNPTKHT